jgi:transposase-like protein
MTESERRGVVSGDSLAPKTRSIKCYAPELKRQIVEETFAPGSSVSMVARRHDVNANLVFAWRQKYRQGALGEGKLTRRRTSPPAQELIRVGVIDADSNLQPLPTIGDSAAATLLPQRGATPSGATSHSVAATGIIEIELPNRVKVRVDGDVSEETLRRILATVREIA